MAAPSDEDFGDDLADHKEAWSRHEIGPSMASRLTSEVVGTFLLMAGGLSIGLFAGPYTDGSTLVIGLGWALTVIVIINTTGHISGAHINPAVTIGLWAAGRFPGRDIAPYILAQVTGAVLGSGLVRLMVDLSPFGPGGAAAMSEMSIGYGEHSRWGVSLAVGLLAEGVLTLGLVATVLAASSVRAPAGQAPYTIGMALSLLIMIGIPLTNAGLNPARATGAAVWAEPWALGQLWAWWLAPLMGALLVGLAFRAFGPVEDQETVQLVDAVSDR